jgi:hypothetical protein
MNERHGLLRLVLGSRDFVEISATEFAEFRRARKCALVALNIEEKATLVLENYAEFELEMLKAALDELIFDVDSWSAMMSTLQLLNRRLINLLTACRLYVDQIEHDLNAIIELVPDADIAVKSWKSAEYDRRLGYRAMEALRNYVQHRGLPIGSITYHGSWDHAAEPPRATNIVTPYLHIDRIAADGGFKASVARELLGVGAKIDIKPLVREYIEGIGTVHQQVRELIEPIVARSDAVSAASHDRWRSSEDPSTIGLAAVRQNGDGTILDHEYMFDESIERRRWLIRRTSSMTHYGSRAQ